MATVYRIHGPASKTVDSMASSGPVLIGSAVLVTGNSYSVKDSLKKVGEGTWCKPLNGWVFPEHKRSAVEQACKAAGATVETGEAVKAAPTPSIEAHAVLKVVRHKKAVLVTGDTKLVKEQLGALGGSWNGKLGGYILPGKSGGAVVALLRQDPTNTVTAGDDTSEPAAKKAKREAKDDDEDDEDDGSDDDQKKKKAKPAPAAQKAQAPAKKAPAADKKKAPPDSSSDDSDDGDDSES